MAEIFAGFKWIALLDDRELFIEGLITTLEVAVFAMLLSLILGIIFGIAGVFPKKWVRCVDRVYVEFFQNTPLVIQAIFLYHALPHLHIMLPVIAIGILGVGIYSGAYMSEIFRSGINAVPKGQMESGMSQGFGYWKIMWYIILPQAKRTILPALGNQSIGIIKNTSVLAMIAGGDLMYTADSWAGANMYYGPAYLVTGFIYWMLCFPLTKWVQQLEKKAEVG
ncbi:amino acid ABC transporter permease [Megasphaera paucivorans]|uniref:Amino acid ABC transporter membrane protein 1, PAAT family (TC 3.A.1.3.-) n=1 Tax=Megasphaera paucivorans TaxID=349095 RepID=A0A1G9TP29_9FIRM|nr:amino acid ABC transporter permease [Megasphaera paucivorans]SDM49288.1 amino acid ABC transporter membrane protein 1, PAAT family (TC 3.A.1.3.-) [Megasphaera paucivorans]